SCLPCLVYLIVRLHGMVLQEMPGRWRLSKRQQLFVVCVLIFIEVVNMPLFALHATNSRKAEKIAQSEDLAWMAERGGVLLIFGDFGQPEQVIHVLVSLGVTLAVHTPVMVGLSLHSISTIRERRKTVMSSRTLRMLNQMLEISYSQLKVTILNRVVPLLAFLI
ncbi:hypothetical protein PENTCL1PPCAC_13575, partial [Pristionchus entomophagus]